MSIISPAPDSGNTPPCHVFAWCEEPEHESPLFGWYPALDGSPFRDHSVTVSPAASLVVHEAATFEGVAQFNAPKLRVHNTNADFELADVEAACTSATALAASLVLPDAWAVVPRDGAEISADAIGGGS